MKPEFSAVKQAYKGSMVVNETPMVAFIDDFLTAPECDHVISLARGKIKRAKVSMDDKATFSDGRTGSNCWIAHDEDKVIGKIARRISDLVGIPLGNAESMQVVHYGSDQEYRAHFDAYNLTTSKGRRCCQFGGQRLVTALVYLNTVAKGGATAFPKLAAEVDAQRGRVCLFHNTESDFVTPHPDSLHAGTPVIEGEKWAFNIWFRSRPMTEAQDFDSYHISGIGSEPGRDSVGATAAARADLSAPTRSLQIECNRAKPFITAAALEVNRSKPPRDPVMVFYWDTFKEEPPGLSQASAASVRQLVDRKITNRLADSKRLYRSLIDEDRQGVVPVVEFESERAIEVAKSDEGLWFLRNGLSVKPVSDEPKPLGAVLADSVSKSHFYQRVIDQPQILEGEPLSLRVFLLIYDQQLYLYRQGLLARGDGLIGQQTFVSTLSEAQQSEDLATAAREAIEQALPVFAEVYEASSAHRYALLSVDLGIDNSGCALVLRCSNAPNFHVGSALETSVVIPLFTAVLNQLLGRADEDLILLG